MRKMHFKLKSNLHTLENKESRIENAYTRTQSPAKLFAQLSKFDLNSCVWRSCLAHSSVSSSLLHAAFGRKIFSMFLSDLCCVNLGAFQPTTGAFAEEFYHFFKFDSGSKQMKINKNTPNAKYFVFGLPEKCRFISF